MAINSIMNIGVQGMRQTYGEIAKSADQIVKAGAAKPEQFSEADIVEPIVNMKMEQHIFDASARIVKTADDVLGTLMDIKV